LRERLEDGHGGDPGAPAFGHERRQRGQGCQVADLIERQQQWRIEARAGIGRGQTPGGLYDVFHERRHQRRGVVRAGAGGEQVEAAADAQERFGVEVLTLAARSRSRTQPAPPFSDRENPLPDYHPADLTAEWRERASRLLGSDATSWVRGVTANDAPLLLRADDIPLEVIASLGQLVVDVVGEKRSTWRRWNLTAEAARQTMSYRFASTVDREAVVGLVVDAAEAASLRLTPPELATSPAVFQRADGTSVFRPKHSTAFSSEVLLAAEDRLHDRARTTTGPTVPLATVERIAARPDRKGHTLGDDQAAALAKIAVSGRIIDVLVGPAGAGKTTAMNALRRAWEREHGAGSAVGLAPSRAPSPSTASPRWPSRPVRKCCWSATTHSSSPWMPVVRSRCLFVTGRMPPSWSTCTGS